MLETISLQNFKGFKDLENLKIKPITILCGPNSCGKSSILQSLLLLKQTIESQDPNQTLLLNGRFVHLGSFENIIFEKNSEHKLCFDLTFKLTPEIINFKSKSHTTALKFLFLQLLPNRSLSPHSDTFIHAKFVLTTPRTLTKTKNLMKTVTVEQFQFDIESRRSDQEKIIGLSINIVKNSNDDLYTIAWQNLRTNGINKEEVSDDGEISAQIKFDRLFSIRSTFSDIPDEKRGKFIRFLEAINGINKLFQIIFSSYSYIGPLREEPCRRYVYEDEITEIGVKGENAAYIYLIDRDKAINNHYFYDRKTNSFKLEKKGLTLSVAMQKWLDLMNIKDIKSELNNEIVYLNLNANANSKTRVNIADVGFGVSQIFPIILEGLRMPQCNTLLLEQPEIHLHPNLQMQLADYFIALAKSGKNLMVETHSDHIINRLVRRIVEDETGTLNDLISIYFIRATEVGSVCEEVRIDENFGVTNWPTDFFDQAALEQENIMKAGLKKRQLARQNNSKN